MSFSESLTDLENELGYTFSDKRLLEDALTHKSFFHENPGLGCFHNERLEFLGDTVLGLVIAELLYLIDPPLAESEMAKIKSYLVSGKTLSRVAEAINLGKYIKLGKGEIGTGGRRKASILADTLESLFGAVFIESGFESAKKTVLRVFPGIIEETFENKKYMDYKTELQELCQDRFSILPDYRVINEEGLEHQKIYTVRVSIREQALGTGTGTSKKDAEINAARDALLKINFPAGKEE